MRNFSSTRRLSLACIAALALAGSACGGEGKDEGADDTGTADESGETAETSATMEGDGDGDGGDGDGDGGDGDGDGGDGDGDAGDGDGDGGDGDGDGEGGAQCPDYATQVACEADPACQAVNGQLLKQNGPDAPCLEPAAFLGCIPMQGCGDAPTWFCIGGGGNDLFLVGDTCGPEGAEMCEPMLPIPGDCP
jgi:hypothetical protein